MPRAIIVLLFLVIVAATAVWALQTRATLLSVQSDLQSQTAASREAAWNAAKTRAEMDVKLAALQQELTSAQRATVGLQWAREAMTTRTTFVHNNRRWWRLPPSLEELATFSFPDDPTKFRAFPISAKSSKIIPAEQP